MKTLTSEEIISNPEDLYESVPFQYQLTDGEIEWFWFVTQRYGIADWIQDNTNGDFLLTITDDSIITMSETLDDDAMPPKAVCLSDDSALQHIFFYLYNGEN